MDVTPQSRFAEVNGIRLHYLEAGSGPLVLLCHGWPELAHSWRNQIPALAAAGYRVVAPDMRGFGASDAPADIAAYGIMDLVGDMVALVEVLDEPNAVVVGHDWGAPVAWHCALFRPDLFRGVAGLSVPWSPRGPASVVAVARHLGMERFYMVYFQEPGVAEADLERDAYESHRRLLVGASGDAVRTGRAWPAVIPEGMTLVEACPAVDTLPAWLSEADLTVYAETYRRTGYRGGLNWYRNMDRNHAVTAPWVGARIPVPACFIAGTLDGVLKMPGMDKAVHRLDETCIDFRGTTLVEGAGHWVQQEAPEAVNKALLDFLAGL
ncbi:alpha/beta fold hydrolase [Oleisolibacter albus]|uniref:alpha/beta fold hydrolase n=1 Tax=Oleisolibacter albus TaxID=2171757 RepID=UPI001961D523|nr:alpha/beta hydrolase [Oleisolibacter albus]